MTPLCRRQGRRPDVRDCPCCWRRGGAGVPFSVSPRGEWSAGRRQGAALRRPLAGPCDRARRAPKRSGFARTRPGARAPHSVRFARPDARALRLPALHLTMRIVGAPPSSPHPARHDGAGQDGNEKGIISIGFRTCQARAWGHRIRAIAISKAGWWRARPGCSREDRFRRQRRPCWSPYWSSAPRRHRALAIR